MRNRPGFGNLILIGGHEDKKGDKIILRAVAKEVGRGKLVVATIASDVPKELFDEYNAAFRSLGVRHVHHLSFDTREEAMRPGTLRVLDDASVVFFTGGDQLRITSQMGDTPVYTRVKQIFESGGTIAGTSAGASVMTETMVVSGESEETNKIGDLIKLAPGFGLIGGVVVDQHFAQRGRVARLLGVVAQNPRILGIGIDENAAIRIRRGTFQCIGENAVYVLDASRMQFTNVAEGEPDESLCVYGVRIHVMNQSDKFNLKSRRPKHFPVEVVLDELGVKKPDDDAAGAERGKNR
jgi:cyanophycinase